MPDDDLMELEEWVECCDPLLLEGLECQEEISQIQEELWYGKIEEIPLT